MIKNTYFYTIKIDGKEYQYISYSYHIKTIAHTLRIPKENIARGAASSLPIYNNK